MYRIKRYNEKLDYISSKMESLPDNFEDPIVMDAILYRVQSSIDAMIDICAMLCKDMGYDVEDDYTNIEKLNEARIFGNDLTSRLKQLNGLRNIIVHKYNGVQEDIITENLNVIQGTLREFDSVVKTSLQDID